MSTSRRSDGFTLTELAIVLVIVTLLMGGLLPVISTQVALRQAGETQRLLNDIPEALIGYAASHSAANTNKPYLPCPDKTAASGAGIANDGIEDRDPTTGQCVTQQGNLPWVSLGVGTQDSWGNRLLYAVPASYSRADNGFVLSASTSGTLRVCQEASCTNLLATSLPAVVLSFGKNGYGANTAAGSAIPSPVCSNSGASCQDESENRDADSDFVMRTQLGRDADNVEFDDLVVWLSPNILYNRMIAAGRLP